jgi:hypothetical protein
MRRRVLVFAGFLGLWAVPAFAQGCAMCYSSASAATKAGQNAISKAVIVLLLPPVGFMTVGIGAALRYGWKRDQEQDPTDESPQS